VYLGWEEGDWSVIFWSIYLIFEEIESVEKHEKLGWYQDKSGCRLFDGDY
jgi:hypothetical protein